MTELTGKKPGRMNYEKPKLVVLCPKESSEEGPIEGAPETCIIPGISASCSTGSGA